MQLLSERFERTVGVGILSWKSDQTLRNTLTSHTDKGLFQLFDQALIHFQEVRDSDKELAAEFELDWIGSEHNRHIGGGFYHLIRNMDTDYLFLLEDDLVLDGTLTDLFEALSDALYLSERDEIDLFRCRRRGNLQATYTKYRKIHDFDNGANDVPLSYFKSVAAPVRLFNRLRNPLRAERTVGKAPWAEKYPETVYPRRIRRLPAIYNNVYVLRGNATKWSNPAIFARRSLLLGVYDYIASHTPGFEHFGLSLEKLVNKRHRAWWLSRQYRIGVTKKILIDHARKADGGKTNAGYVRVD